MTPGERIFNARQARGLSLREAVERVGVSHVFWREVERGEKRPSPEKARLFARAVGLDARELLRAFGADEAAKAMARWEAAL